MSKTHIKVWLTKNTKQIRARITEETEGVGNYTYEVTVGGKEWNNGKGQKHKEAIKKKVTNLENKFNSLKKLLK